MKAGKDNVCANLIMLSAITNNWISDRRPSAYLKDLADWHGEDVFSYTTCNEGRESRPRRARG